MASSSQTRGAIFVLRIWAPNVAPFATALTCCGASQQMRTISTARTIDNARGVARNAARAMRNARILIVGDSVSQQCSRFNQYDAILLVDPQNCFMEERSTRESCHPTYHLHKYKVHVVHRQ